MGADKLIDIISVTLDIPLKESDKLELECLIERKEEILGNLVTYQEYMDYLILSTIYYECISEEKFFSILNLAREQSSHTSNLASYTRSLAKALLYNHIKSVLASTNRDINNIKQTYKNSLVRFQILQSKHSREEQ